MPLWICRHSSPLKLMHSPFNQKPSHCIVCVWAAWKHQGCLTCSSSCRWPQRESSDSLLGETRCLPDLEEPCWNRPASLNVQVNGACPADVWNKLNVAREETPRPHNIILPPPRSAATSPSQGNPSYFCINIRWACKMWNAMNSAVPAPCQTDEV